MTIDPCADNDDDFAASKISKEESWDFFCWLMMFWCFQAFQIMFLNQILDWCSNASSFVKEIPMQVSALFCLMGTLGGCCCCFCCSVLFFGIGFHLADIPLGDCGRNWWHLEDPNTNLEDSSICSPSFSMMISISIVLSLRFSSLPLTSNSNNPFSSPLGR